MKLLRLSIMRKSSTFGASIIGIVLSSTMPLSTFAQISVPPEPPGITQNCGRINIVTGNLYRGLSSDSVMALQEYLSLQGYFTMSPTGYFGPITAKAVAAFQLNVGLPSTGYFGPLSREWITKHCGGGTISSVNVYSLTPMSGTVGAQVSIDGFGFNSDNSIHFGSGVIMHVPSSGGIAIACTTDPNCRGGIHQSLSFTVPSSLDPACRFSTPACAIASQQTAPGKYDVWVENSNGSSPHVTFTVTGQTADNGPSIASIAPLSGMTGTQVTLYGSGFTSNDVVMIGDGSVSGVTASSNGASLTFTVPSGVGPYCPPGSMCPMYLKQLTPGTYDVYVKDVAAGVDSNKVQFTVTGSVSGQTISVSGVDAPSTLALGTIGTWTVHAQSSSANANLHYSVVWGDEAQNTGASIMAPQPTTIQTSASFTHAYHQSGTYTPQFTVTDDSGNSASASASVVVTPLY